MSADWENVQGRLEDICGDLSDLRPLMEIDGADPTIRIYLEQAQHLIRSAESRLDEARDYLAMALEKED